MPEQQSLQKCMCCGRLTDHSYSYVRPSTGTPHHNEWCVDLLTLCLACYQDWNRQFPSDTINMNEETKHAMISSANKWMFDKVAKQLEKSHKKFKIKGFHHEEVRRHCCCIGEYEAADLREAMIRFFDEYPTADEVLEAKEVKEEKKDERS